MITLLITNPDGSTWIAGGFINMTACITWINNIKSLPGFPIGTLFKITDNSKNPPAITTQT